VSLIAASTPPTIVSGPTVNQSRSTPTRNPMELSRLPLAKSTELQFGRYSRIEPGNSVTRGTAHGG
jgi:hypothetical protein